MSLGAKGGVFLAIRFNFEDHSPGRGNTSEKSPLERGHDTPNIFLTGGKKCPGEGSLDRIRLSWSCR